MPTPFTFTEAHGGDMRAPTNLLEDPGAETNSSDPTSDFLSGTSGFGGGWTNQDTNARSGLRALKHDGSAGGTKLYNAALIRVDEDSELYFEVWAKATNANARELLVGIEWQDEGQVMISADSYSQTTLGASPTTYTEISNVVTAPAGAYYARFFLKVAAASAHSWYIDDRNLMEALPIASRGLILTSGMVRFGGTNNTFPALKRDSTAIATKLADDSGYAQHEADTFRACTESASKVEMLAGEGIALASDMVIAFTEAADAGEARDVGLKRSAANVLKVTDGGAGNGSLQAGSLFTPTIGQDASNQHNVPAGTGGTLALQSYVDALLAANDALTFEGAIDCSANPNYPAADAGHVYKVSVAGKIGGASGPNVEAGDVLTCIVDASASGNHATVGANWIIQQANIDGAYFQGGTDVAVADGGTGASTATDARTNLGLGTSNAPQFAGLTIEAAAAGTTIFRTTSDTSYTDYRMLNDQNSSLRMLNIGYTGSAYASAFTVNGPTGEQGGIKTTGNFPIVIGTSNTFRMIIEGGGNIGIGTTTPASKVDVAETTGATLTLKRVDVSVTANDMVGKIQFYAKDTSTTTNFIVADIEAQATNTVATDINPGRLIFRTTDAGVASTPTERLRLDHLGNVIVGTAALATTATDGFLYIPSCAGAPTGVPTANTGRVPMIYDSTNHKFYIYAGGAWKQVAMV